MPPAHFDAAVFCIYPAGSRDLPCALRRRMHSSGFFHRNAEGAVAVRQSAVRGRGDMEGADEGAGRDEVVTPVTTATV